MPQATTREADLLRPEVIRNEVVETVDQMERIQLAEESGFASALNTFPVVNVDDPQEAWYTYDGATRPMEPSEPDAESPIGTLSLPSKENIETQAYKKKYNPEKGVERRLSDVPFSVHRRAVEKLQLKIYLTRELISWRGDRSIDGLIGVEGQTAHPEIPTDHVITAGTSWSDEVNSDPIDELGTLAYETTANGFYGNGVPPRPNIYLSPSTLRDLKQNDEMENRLSGVRIQNITRDLISEVIDEDLGAIRRVMVQVPREDANGNMIDENGNGVDDADDAAQDNVLEPYDPSAGTQIRNVVVGRPGAASAYFSFFLQDLLETMDGVDVPGEMAVDDNEGFVVQRVGDWDPIGSWLKGMQQLGFEVPRGENWGVVRDV